MEEQSRRIVDWEGFVLSVLQIFNGFRGPDSGSLWWRTDKGYAPLTIFIPCNDLFWGATSDCEEITPQQLPLLRQTVADIQAITPEDYTQADILFCCRVRGMRPQKPYYKYIPEVLHPLFDACGPERQE